MYFHMKGWCYAAASRWNVPEVMQGQSHIWNKKYALPYTEILCFVLCRITLKIAGIGPIERCWGVQKILKVNGALILVQTSWWHQFWPCFWEVWIDIDALWELMISHMLQWCLYDWMKSHLKNDASVGHCCLKALGVSLFDLD